MKIRIPAFLLFLFLVLPQVSGGGLSEDIYTLFKAGPAYEVNGEICFLLAYKLYQAPRGIRRFPDGGQSHTVFQGTYILILKEGIPKVWKELPGITIGNNKVFTKSKEFLKPIGSLLDEYDTNVTNKLLRQTGPATAGLPSPLLYCKKNRKEYIDDIIRLNGDLSYRQAIILQYITTAEEAQTLLHSMEEYEKKLEGVEQTGYGIYSEDTRRTLQTLSALKEGETP